MYLESEKRRLHKNFRNLRGYVENQKTVLAFAMNKGMHNENNIPPGLFIQDFQTYEDLNISS
jgi:uncharacterized protein YigE (DUF2233 family)